jgi:hypothetical protein
MPAGDGTGPMGMGSMTGRAAGYCAGFTVPGFMNPVPGRGRGMGFGWGRGGRGRGWRHRFYATGLPFWAQTPAPGVAQEVSPVDETQTLKAQAGYMEKALEEIRRRISDLEAAQAKES